MKSKNKHIKTDDFFDYLAEINSASVSKEDLVDLNLRIDKKIKQTKIKINNNNLSIVLVSAFTLVLFFIIFNKKTILQIKPSAENSINPNKKNDILTNAINNDSAIIEEVKFRKSISSAVANSKLTPEHFEITTKDIQVSEKITIDELSLKEVSLIDSNKTHQETEDILQFLPNASIIYIYDLKITQYQKLYFKKLKPFPLYVDGLSAEFEDKDAYNSYYKERSIEKPYTLDMLLKDGLKNLKNQNYKQASVQFEELLSYNQHDPNSLFYSGLCKFYLGDYNTAIKKFSKVLNEENNVFHQEADWYKALSLHSLKENQEAIDLLIKINKQKGFYSKQAGEKLHEITQK